ncbi:galactose mutarotase [Fulvivirga sp. M361]|uniref:aldose epimerase family protein n=1 Tax=Fulvivirga sp. M361 TaxID=2594266 RepID=UPI001179E9D2|nr:aldose epimerase family protein [Fulvivirga sp. M361]TRX59976.1 galactose mutarotase [Fulvivirga sp. M361]
MQIKKRHFGTYQDQNIDQYILTNNQGMRVKIITYGATITSMTIPGERGDLDLVCGFDTLEGYFSAAYSKNAPYFGCTVGRYASRIKDGKFSLNGIDYTLAVNDGSNHLHGGVKGFDKKVWRAEVMQDREEPRVVMFLSSPHLEEGYPGNVEVEVSFGLNHKNELSIRYSAVTDQATPLSLTNHTYFNLSGFKHTIENHKAIIFSDKHLAPDQTNVPVGAVENLSGSPADLSGGKLLKSAFEGLETGFEHYFLFDKKWGERTKAAMFTDTDTGRTLEIETTEPGMLFYSGYFTSDELRRESGPQYGKYRGFCCETHRYPNGPNIKNAPGSITGPGEKYTSETIYRLGW